MSAKINVDTLKSGHLLDQDTTCYPSAMQVLHCPLYLGHLSNQDTFFLSQYITNLEIQDASHKSGHHVVSQSN